VSKYGVGTRHGGYTVVDHVDGDHRRVRCDCGAARVVFTGNLKSNRFGCWDCAMRAHPSRKIDRTGQTFGAWLVIADDDRGCRRKALVRCTKCGHEQRTWLSNVVNGYSKGCAPCAWKENGERARDPNALSHHPLFHTYSGMFPRCFNERSDGYARYGGRGITVSPLWLGDGGFERFAEYMGAKPTDDHSIDRINNNGSYEPGNVRWATQSQQMRNTRRSRLIPLGGELLTMQEAGDRLGISRQAVHQRISWGWTPVEAATTPKGQTPERLRIRAVERPRGRREREIEVDGVRHPVSVWAAAIGVDPQVIRARLSNGWSEREAVTLRKSNHRKTHLRRALAAQEAA